MDKPWLSILIPSINPEGLARFLATLQMNFESVTDVELIIDKEPSNGIGELYSRMLPKAQSEWVWVANDDLMCETPSWLYKFKQATEKFPDGVALIYPNDKLFEDSFCCFPLVRKDIFELLMPMPYKKYKVDDSVMHVIPKERWIYLGDVIMRHMNFNFRDQPGFLTKSGNVYPIDPKAAEIDTQLFEKERVKLSDVRRTIEKRMGIEHPDKKVLIGCITAEFARRADFYDYYNAMFKPVGTVCTFAHGQSPAENRNILIDQAFDLNCSHILFLDDDITFKQDMLIELMKHDKDIVTGLMYKRNYPHAPLIFDHYDEEGKCRHKALSPEENGLIEIVACGLGCCLISMDVFRKLEKPYIRLGELDKSGWNDDIGFFKRVREAGFKMYCDLDIRVGHIASMIIWPDKIEGEWMTTYDTYGSGKVSSPQYKRPAVVEPVGVQ